MILDSVGFEEFAVSHLKGLADRARDVLSLFTFKYVTDHFLLLSLGGEICRHGAVSAAAAIFRQRGGGRAVAARHQDDDVSDISDVRYGA